MLIRVARILVILCLLLTLDEQKILLFLIMQMNFHSDSTVLMIAYEKHAGSPFTIISFIQSAYLSTYLINESQRTNI